MLICFYETHVVTQSALFNHFSSFMYGNGDQNIKRDLPFII